MIKIAIGITAAAGVAAAIAMPASPAQAQRSAAQIIVYGNDPCPRSTDDEIVVCARRPEEERYRLPKDSRPAGDRQETTSWVNKADAMMNVGNTGTNTCSPVGPGGHTGCLRQQILQGKREGEQNNAPAPQ